MFAREKSLRLIPPPPVAELPPPRRKTSLLGDLALGSVIGLGALALFNQLRARAAERVNPPLGRFVTVEGVRLHYITRGSGEVVTLIHGNGMTGQDFEIAGLIDALAMHFRVIVFDRPGYGYSERPRRDWGPADDAALLENALARLGVSRAVVVGHSYGALVAMALALNHPARARGLVLISGYYYPTLRSDVFLMSPPALPVFGDFLRHTFAPLLARAWLPVFVKRLFEPSPVPAAFERHYPRGLAVRPSQLRAEAQDAAAMTPAALALCDRYKELKMPVMIVAGSDDKWVDVSQANRLHKAVAGSQLVLLPGLGHMAHHLATERVAEAVELAAKKAEEQAAAAPRYRAAS